MFELEVYMRKLIVLICVELEVFDDWEFVEYFLGIEVFKIGDNFVDFDIVFLSIILDDVDVIWFDMNVDLVEMVLFCVIGFDIEFEFSYI